MYSSRLLVLALIGVSLALAAPLCQQNQRIRIGLPFEDQLSLVGDVNVRVLLPPAGDPATLLVELDGGGGPVDVTALLPPNPQNPLVRQGPVPVAAAGDYQLTATISFAQGPDSVLVRSFEIVDLENPGECEVLNNASCLLPYPSSRFLDQDPSTLTGLRINLPGAGLPPVIGDPLDPDVYNVDHVLDGFSPTAQILMHFPSGVNLVASNASRLLPPMIATPVSPPYVDTRTYDGTSLEVTSPTLLIHADSGEQILHFVELDARAAGAEIPGRQALIMRPGLGLTPGERYIVAIRNLVDGGGAPVEPEPPFAVLRDQRLTDIAAINARRGYYEDNIFPQLAAAGVAREELILAFDFTVHSEEGLTGQVISMRDQSLAWLAGQGSPTFTVDSVEENDCSLPDETIWRIVRGSYQVPLFLTLDPGADVNSLGVLNLDPSGDPVQNGLTNPPFTVGIPCSVLEEAGPIVHPIVLGHGLFGEGDGMAAGLVANPSFDFIGGATDWWGLSNRDYAWVAASIIGHPALGGSKLNNFPAFADRLKQGQINTQVLARMMKQGLFNSHACFQIRDPNPLDCTIAGPDPTAEDVFPGASSEMFYFGVSLGGIMGTYFASLTSDVERFNVDVPGMNFSFLMQRAQPFKDFDALLESIGLTDPMDTVLGLGLIHELWVRGGPAGYMESLRAEVAANTKKMLVTVAWLDKQVSNQVSEVLARTLGVPSLQGSLQVGLQGIPDLAGPLDSALVIYDTGSFDIFHIPHYGLGPDGLRIIPPLANVIPSSVCDPHGRRGTIPASIDQLLGFLQPGGQIENFCTDNGVCDASEDYEKPNGESITCDPLAP